MSKILRYLFTQNVNNSCEVIFMFYITPSLKEKFDSLDPKLQNAISQRDVSINTLSDLIKCLEQIVAEGEGREN